MKTSVVSVLLTLLLATCSFGRTINNSDVRQMVRSGAPVAEIVATINNSESGFRLYSEDVVFLKRVGIPDIIIDAMFARNANDRLVLVDVITQDRPNIERRDFNLTAGRRVRGESLIVDPQPVRLRLTRNLSSEHVRNSDVVYFEVLEDVCVNNGVGKFLVIQRGASAWGTVVAADPKRRMGRSGKIEVALDSVRLANGDKMALTGTTTGDRHGHVGLMVGLMVPTVAVYFPAAPLWLLMHGKEAKIDAGFDLTASTDGVANLDSSEFERR